MGKNWMRNLFICTLVLIFLSGCYSMKEQNSTIDTQGFRWIREESGFIDYAISNDTIQFRYAFCFENNSDDNVTLSFLSAKFKKSELTGWLRYEKFYEGVLEDGGFSITIKAGEKINVIYVFSGEYLGGTVYENLSVSDIVMLQDHEFGTEDGGAS